MIVSPRLRRSIATWSLLLIGAIAAAFMLPQFAIFIPIVAAAWILARLGFTPRFLSHRHAAARFAPGADAPFTTLHAVFESESSESPTASELVSELVARADDVAGSRVAASSGDCIRWRAGSPRTTNGELRLDHWPHVRAAVEQGDGLVLATKAEDSGRVHRIEAMLAGDRALLESIALAHAEALRAQGVETITTGWLRHAERVRAGRR